MNLAEFQCITDSRARFALIGYPIGHSVSPELHAAVFSRLHMNARYDAVAVESEQLSAFTDYARMHLRGFNITIPHKKAILPFLDEIDPAAAAIGAVNTVLVRDGKLIGSNTDYSGLEKALRAGFPSFGEGGEACILGCGGFARVAAVLLARNGYRVTVAARDLAKAQAFVDSLPEHDGMSVCTLSGLPAGHPARIVINCTPVGMAPKEGLSPVNLKRFTQVQFVYDAIYNPPRTALLRDAQARGVAFDNGLSLLIGQGLNAEEIWQGRPMPPELMPLLSRQLVIDLARRRIAAHPGGNLILSGFMGSGKTTVGKRLAAMLDMPFVDVDSTIEQDTAMPISEIFSQFGEPHFRALERAATSKACTGHGAVISLGGGAILDDDNAVVCRRGGLTVFLEGAMEYYLRNLGFSDGTRPMINGKSPEEIRALYQERLPFYRSRCDFVVPVFGDPEQSALAICQNI